MPVNIGLAQLSDHFLLATVFLYALAMLAYAGDFAFGQSTRKSAAPAGAEAAAAESVAVADAARVAVPAGVTASAAGAETATLSGPPSAGRRPLGRPASGGGTVAAPAANGAATVPASRWRAGGAPAGPWIRTALVLTVHRAHHPRVRDPHPRAGRAPGPVGQHVRVRHGDHLHGGDRVPGRCRVRFRVYSIGLFVLAAGRARARAVCHRPLHGGRPAGARAALVLDLDPRHRDDRGHRLLHRRGRAHTCCTWWPTGTPGARRHPPDTGFGAILHRLPAVPTPWTGCPTAA